MAVRTPKTSFGSAVADVELSTITTGNQSRGCTWTVWGISTTKSETMLNCSTPWDVKTEAMILFVYYWGLPLEVIIRERSTKYSRWMDHEPLREALKRRLDVQEASRRRAFGADAEHQYTARHTRQAQFRNMSKTDAFPSNESEPKRKTLQRSAQRKEKLGNPKERCQALKIRSCAFCDGDHYSNECENFSHWRSARKSCRNRSVASSAFLSSKHTANERC